MTTPAHVYSLPYKELPKYLRYPILGRIFQYPYNLDYDKLENLARVSVRQHGFADCRDGRRYGVFASVWLDGKPFAIVESAGREGDDHVKVYITDPRLEKEVEAILILECCDDDVKDDSYISILSDVPEMGVFYDHDFIKNPRIDE